MAASESLRFDIVGNDRASAAFSSVGRSAEAMSGKMGDAAAKAAFLDDALKRQTSTTRATSDAMLSLAKSDAILIEVEARLRDGALEAEFALKKQADSSKALGEQAAAAAGGVSTLAGGGGGYGGIAALIGAGVALSPVIATLATGLAGFGLAAYGVAKPIENAAQKTGGLAANMKLLDPEQQAVARGILALGQQYDVFQKALKPEVLGVFGAGLKLAADLMHDVQPVAVATGKALGVMLGQIDREFQSGSWQQFFGFMARTAGPDMQLLGNLFTSLAADLPPLLEGLQPVAAEILTLTTGALNAVGVLAQLASRLDQVGASAVKAAEITSGSTGPGDTWTNPLKDFTNFLGDVSHSIPGASKLVTALGGGVTSAGIAAANAGAAGKGAAKSFDLMGNSAATTAVKVKTLAQQVSDLTNSENSAISPLLGYTNALIAQRNDADKLSTALKGSSGQVGLNTAAERNSFSAANTYIQDLLNTSSAAVKSHQGIDAQIGSIRQALPLLEHVKGGTQLYWQEVRSLVSWLQQLEKIKQLSEVIAIKGQGTWSISSGGNVFPVKAAASGTYISGGRAGVDDQLILAQRGELVVPPHLVAGGAVDHLRGWIPGFASGGIVGSYGGPFAGLQPWAGHNMNATAAQITASIGSAMARQFASAAFGGSVGGTGVTRWAPVILQALAMLGQSPVNLGAVEHRMNQESGGNPYAINLWDINAKNGDPSRGLMQVIMATFQRYRSFALPNDIYNPLANVFAGLHYAELAYPGRSLSSVMLQAGGYDHGGYLPPGLSLAYNGTGQPEPVGPARAAQTIIIRVDPAVAAVTPDRQLGRHIASHLGAHLKAGGRIYPAGSTPR